jgi:hypothetical protein
LHAETDFRRVFAEVLRSSFELSAGDLAKVFPGAELGPVGLMRA